MTEHQLPPAWASYAIGGPAAEVLNANGPDRDSIDAFHADITGLDEGVRAVEYDGDIVYLSDGQPFLRLTPATFGLEARAFIPISASPHVRGVIVNALASAGMTDDLGQTGVAPASPGWKGAVLLAAAARVSTAVGHGFGPVGCARSTACGVLQRATPRTHSSRDTGGATSHPRQLRPAVGQPTGRGCWSSLRSEGLRWMDVARRSTERLASMAAGIYTSLRADAFGLSATVGFSSGSGVSLTRERIHALRAVSEDIYGGPLVWLAPSGSEMFVLARVHLGSPLAPRCVASSGSWSSDVCCSRCSRVCHRTRHGELFQLHEKALR